MTLDVLVTGAGALLGQGVLKALDASPNVGRIVGADLSPRAVGLWLCDSAHLLPPFTSDNYVDEVIRVAKGEAVRAILCGTDLEVPILAVNRARIEAESGAVLVVSSPETVAIADDKWLTHQFLQTSGFDTPRSALGADGETLANHVGFPLIVKPRIGAGSVGLSVVDNLADLRQAARAEGMIVQEYLRPDNEEYTCGAVVFDGRCRGVTVLKRTLRYGNTHTAESGDYERIAAYVGEVAERLPGAYGPINFQLRNTDRGPVIFEINARFSGTTPLRAALGFNEVDAVLMYVCEGRPIPEARLDRKLVLRWTAEVLVDLAQVDQLVADGYLPKPSGETSGNILGRS